jgi:pyruvate/2-oxoglutarate/acetoin dehydrogenase E1 component
VSDRQDMISFGAAVNEAITLAMIHDPSVICYGLGTTDPKGIFGTTLGLRERFGETRVFDMPTSENGMTGIAVGAALAGLRPIMTHQRLDFFLLALDQLVNAAAKWHYMFGGAQSVPITIRLIVGRGWGQGPTHSQNLQAWFAHIPGLKVVMPATADDAKGLLLASIFDPNPVVFIEHRWLHNSMAAVPKGDFRLPIGKVRTMRNGKDLTIVAMSYMTVEAMHAADYLARRFGISAEVIDLRTIRPLDWPGIMESVGRTGRLLALDSGFTTGSVAGEVVARVSMELFSRLLAPPRRLGMPDMPEPTSPALTRGFYVRAGHVVNAALAILEQPAIDIEVEIPEPVPHDVPGSWFKGPF